MRYYQYGGNLTKLFQIKNPQVLHCQRH
nr:unnamed protein product [Callosobruchus analis]